MRALGFEVRKVDVLKILKDYDRAGTGKISFDDFTEVGQSQCGSNFKARHGRQNHRFFTGHWSILIFWAILHD